MPEFVQKGRIHKITAGTGITLNPTSGEDGEIEITNSSPASLGTTPSTQAFGDSAAGGSATSASKNDHKHAFPANPVTAHEGAADPHTQYLEISGTNKITVSTVAPTSPATGDLWVDTT